MYVIGIYREHVLDNHCHIPSFHWLDQREIHTFNWLKYQRFKSTFSASSDVYLRKMEEILQGKKKLPEKLKSREELEMLCCKTTWAEVSFPRFETCECQKIDIFSGRLSSLWSGRPAVVDTSVEEIAITLTRFWKHVSRHFVQEVLGYTPKKENASFANGSIMTISRFGRSVVTVVRCSVEKEIHIGH